MDRVRAPCTTNCYNYQFRFASRIRNLQDTRLYVPGALTKFPEPRAMIGSSINVEHILAHWDEILRLATSIKQGSITGSLMVRVCSFEAQRYRASGLNLVMAAIALWNTVYLERAVSSIGPDANANLLQYLSPLGWDNINLTGDYLRQQNRKIKPGQFRNQRPYVGA